MKDSGPGKGGPRRASRRTLGRIASRDSKTTIENILQPHFAMDRSLPVRASSLKLASAGCAKRLQSAAALVANERVR